MPRSLYIYPPNGLSHLLLPLLASGFCRQVQTLLSYRSEGGEVSHWARVPAAAFWRIINGNHYQTMAGGYGKPESKDDGSKTSSRVEVVA
jgi:hypothetical protein